MISIERLLNAALGAVADACVVTRRVQNSSEQTIQILKGDKSPVTVADFAAQAIVNQRLHDVLGQALVVGEESADALRETGKEDLRHAVLDNVRAVWKDASIDAVVESIDRGNHDASAGSYWTLDPVDGTKGFLRGEQYAVSLAYIEDGKVSLGVLGCPNLSPDFERPFSDPDPRGLIYFATRGGGTQVTAADAPLQKITIVKPDLPDATAKVRVCESVEAGHSKQDQSVQIIDALGGAGAPARLDSQCKYAVVARGQADAYLRLPTRADYHEKIWDHAAGMLVAMEAGMIVTDIAGVQLDFSRGTQLLDNRGIVCASPIFHERIIAAIAQLGLRT